MVCQYHKAPTQGISLCTAECCIMYPAIVKLLCNGLSISQSPDTGYIIVYCRVLYYVPSHCAIVDPPPSAIQYCIVHVLYSKALYSVTIVLVVCVIYCSPSSAACIVLPCNMYSQEYSVTTVLFVCVILFIPPSVKTNED